MPVKIIDLGSETAPTDDDLIIIRDMTTGTTRKITRATFFLNPPIPNNTITTAMMQDASVTKIKLAADAVPTVRSTSSVTPGTLTPDVDNYDFFVVTALANSMTFGAPTGTPVSGQGMLIRVKDNGTARTLTFNAIYRAIGVTLPTATVANKLLYLAARYNAESIKWDIISVGREA